MRRKGFTLIKIILGIILIAVISVIAIFYLYWNSNSYYLSGRYIREATTQEEVQFSNIVNSYKGDLIVALISPFGPFAVESISKSDCNKLSADLTQFDFLEVDGCNQKPLLPNAGNPISTDK